MADLSAKIDKLGIRGIRSFSPANQESMQFNTPLTLIVGYNGSGKTTLIETLKYATTGEQPPNSKGGAFIHDPKLCGEKEVLAQVKLSFRSTVGQKLVVTRSLQLTMKKTQRAMKTLDGSLVIYNNGERTGLSTKVGELDELVPSYLGVSPAILDAVIFCHQDESLWPMSEPAALKKRFDAIFEALKYTKAIDNLKVVRKKQGEELQKLKIFEATSKEAKEKGQRAEKHLAALQTQIEDLREQGEGLTRQMDEVQEEARGRREQASSFFGIVQELKSKQDQYAVRSETVAELEASLVQKRTESDAWLEEHLQAYEARLAQLQEEQTAQTVEVRQLQTELQAARTALGAQQAAEGKLQADHEQYERQVQTRAQMVREAAAQHGIRGYEGAAETLDEGQIRGFRARIERELQERRRALEQLRRAQAEELEEATGAMTTLEGQKAARMQDRATAKQRIGVIERQVAALQRDAARLDVDEGAQAVLAATYTELEERLAAATAALEATTVDGQLEEVQTQIRELEAESERLGEAMMACMRRASERAQLDLRTKELEERRRRLATLTGTWQSRLDALVGAGWTASTVESAFQKVLQERAEAAAKARTRVEERQQELAQTEYRLSTERARQTTMVAEATRCRGQVLEVLRTVKAGEDGEDAGVVTIEEYEEELEHVEGELLTAEKDISLFEHLKDYYAKSHKVLNRFNKCSLCDRSFAEQPRERSKLLEKIAKNLDDGQKRALEADRDTLEQQLGQLRTVRGAYDTLRRLEGEQSGVQAALRLAEGERDELVRQLEDADAAFRVADEARQTMAGLGKTVAGLTQAAQEVAAAEAETAKLRAEVTTATDDGADGRSAEEIQTQQAQCTEQLRRAKGRLTRVTEERQRQRDGVRALTLEKSELTNRVAAAARQVERQADLEAQMQRLRTETAELRAQMQAADEALAALGPALEQARTERQEAQQRAQAQERQAAEARDAVAQTVNAMGLVEKEVAAYEARGGDEALAASGRAVAERTEAVATREQALEAAVAAARRAQEELDHGDREKKNIGDNLALRRNRRQLATLEQEMSALAGRQAEDDYERLVGEARRFEVQYSKLLAERSAIWGNMKSKDEELLRLLKEYEQEYAQAAERYREAHIRVETTKAAIDDLGRYAGALDQAILAYHGQKMEEVNRIAGELWRATYQGTDIDTIRVRSDHETATGKRNYNYRVCMVKRDTEMDMRGRCSAGQKVLASIVIRLALAESFGVSCGLIALDEPTTNLDAENIRSLAVALHALIEARQAQANFQLIVITHDEAFLRAMQCSDFCDTFYRVTRDGHQNSVIKRESIGRLMD